MLELKMELIRDDSTLKLISSDMRADVLFLVTLILSIATPLVSMQQFLSKKEHLAICLALKISRIVTLETGLLLVVLYLQ